MKKILYPLFAALVFGFAFTACSDDDEGNMTFDTTPEIAAAGTYTGTYTRVEDGTTDTITAAGSITIAPTDSAYCADITFTSADLDLDATSVANIAHSNDGFAFSNSSASNGLGAAFRGRIDGNGNINSSFSIQQRVGFRTHTFHYNFIGGGGQ